MASPGPGGPYGLDWRKGRSQRSTENPASQKDSARAASNGAWAFDPAPWERTRPSPPAGSRTCRKPGTGGSTESSENARTVPGDTTIIRPFQSSLREASHIPSPFEFRFPIAPSTAEHQGLPARRGVTPPKSSTAEEHSAPRYRGKESRGCSPAPRG